MTSSYKVSTESARSERILKTKTLVPVIIGLPLHILGLIVNLYVKVSSS